QVSPDARWILMQVPGGAQTGVDIAMAPLQPGAEVQPLIATVGDQGNASLSPDGRWLAYESNESGSNHVFVRPFPDINQGRWQVSTSGGGGPSWSRDGRELFFLDIATAGAGRPSAILSVSVPPSSRFVPSVPTVALKFPANAARSF